MNRETELENDLRNLLTRQNSLIVDAIDDIVARLQKERESYFTEDSYDSESAEGFGVAIEFLKDYASARWGWNPVYED